MAVQSFVPTSIFNTIVADTGNDRCNTVMISSVYVYVGSNGVMMSILLK